MIDKLLGYIKKLPVAKFLRPIWSRLLKSLIQTQGDNLQALINKEAEKSPEAVTKAIEKWGREIRAFLETCTWLPDFVRLRVIDFVKVHESSLASRAGTALKEGGIPAMNRVYDELQESLKARIDAL